MAEQDGRRKSLYNQDCQCNAKNVDRGLGGPEAKGISSRNDSHSVFYSDSKGRDKTGAWLNSGGQATTKGIHRRLKELQKAWLELVESQQQQLEISLRETKHLATEMHNLQAMLAETLDDIPEE